LRQAVQVADDRGGEIGVIDRLARRGVEQQEYVGDVVVAECLVFEPSRARRFRGRIVPPADAEVIAEAEAVHPEGEQPGDHDPDDRESPPDERIGPARELGEQCRLLIDDIAFRRGFERVKT
jgi:hypothetical protein